MTQKLFQLAKHFTLLKLHISVQLKESTELPSFKGSMLHGWFGHALKAADERAFHICYGVHDGQQPKPYLICPSQDHKTSWKKGEIFEFELTLFGEAVTLVDAIFKALHIGEKMGFGPKRTAFQVIAIASQTPIGLVPKVQVHTLWEWLEPRLYPSELEEQSEIAIAFETPARLKLHGSITHQPPLHANFYCTSIFRRLQLLSRYWALDSDELFYQIHQEVNVVQNLEVTSHCYFEDWQRFSLKQTEQLPFGGLKGQLSFFGNTAVLKPMLLIGQQLHIGGKTTFGLGKIKVTTS